MIHALGALRAHRTALLTLLGFGLIIAGIWTAITVAFGSGYGTAAGLLSTGMTLLIVDGLSE